MRSLTRDAPFEITASRRREGVWNLRRRTPGGTVSLLAPRVRELLRHHPEWRDHAVTEWLSPDVEPHQYTEDLRSALRFGRLPPVALLTALEPILAHLEEGPYRATFTQVPTGALPLGTHPLIGVYPLRSVCPESPDAAATRAILRRLPAPGAVDVLGDLLGRGAEPVGILLRLGVGGGRVLLVDGQHKLLAATLARRPLKALVIERIRVTKNPPQMP